MGNGQRRLPGQDGKMLHQYAVQHLHRQSRISELADCECGTQAPCQPEMPTLALQHILQIGTGASLTYILGLYT